MEKTIEIAAAISPEEKTWDMLNGICHHENVVGSIIKQLVKHQPFSAEEEKELIECVRKGLDQGLIVIPGKSFFTGRDIFNPSEYKWTEILYGLHKSYDWLFIQLQPK